MQQSGLSPPEATYSANRMSIKINAMKYLSQCLLAFLLITMTNLKCKKENSNECASCEQIQPIQSFSSVSGVLRKVADGEPYYDGRKYYILIDAETSFPSLYRQNNTKYERVFPCSRAPIYSDSDTGRVVSISGELLKCTTGRHGLLTNNLITFNIYSP